MSVFYIYKSKTKSKDIDDICNFIKQCLESRTQLMKSNISKDEKYYAIEAEWISQFKIHIGFDEILSNYKKHNSIDSDILKEIIEKSTNKTQISRLDNTQIYSKKSSIKKNKKSDNEYKIINSTAYNVIKKYFSEEEKDSFDGSELERGKNKYILKVNNYIFKVKIDYYGIPFIIQKEGDEEKIKYLECLLCLILMKKMIMKIIKIKPLRNLELEKNIVKVKEITYQIM